MRRIVAILSLLFSLALGTYGQAWSGVLSPARATDWTKAGMQGGIPSGSWTQCGSTIAAYGTSGTPASPATIQTAINACGTNQYVQLGSGSFYLSGSVHVKAQSNIEIRGMGANSTFLYFYGNTDPVSGDNCGGLYSLVCFESSDVNWVGPNGDGTGFSNGPVNWTAGYAQGTTVITLASVPNLKIGNPIILDQQDTTTDTGAILEKQDTTNGHPFTSPGNAGPYSAQGGSLLAGRNQVHVHTVVGCNGSTTIGVACSGTNVAVTIDPPLEEANWSTSLSTQAWWATNPDLNVGVQNVALDSTNVSCTFGANNSLVGFFNVAGGWVSGVRTVNACRNHHNVQYSTRITSRNNYMFLSRFSSSTSYGLECFLASNSLLENNIMQAIAGAIILNEGCSGWVLGYNFEINGYFQAAGFVIPMANMHGVNDEYNLFEGNVGSLYDGDEIHGSHNFDTVFRNRLAGQNPVCWQSGPTNNDYASYLASTWGVCTSATNAFRAHSNNRFFNAIGNVWGTTGVTTSYKFTGGTSDVDAYVLNFVGDDHNGAVVPYDTTIVQTVMLWGNCDNVNGFSAANCLFNNSDVPVTGNLAASQQAYANTIPSSHTLPASFYYSSKPSWWPASKAWPPIGPDVTGGNISGVGGLAYTNPAQDCYNSLTGSTANGTGGPFPFDANTCYSGTLAVPMRSAGAQQLSGNAVVQ
jgi:hypothetical protein